MEADRRIYRGRERKESERPQLRAAQAACKKHKARLVIAKLDRLSRNVAFIANLLEAGTDFVAVDNPQANKSMLQMMAVFAEMERDAILKRTTEALAAAKARGVKLGNPRLADAIEATNKARQEAADAFAARKAASAASVESPRPYLLAGSRLLAGVRGRLCRCRTSCSALSRQARPAAPGEVGRDRCSRV